jgi:hypothetical protein
MKMTEQRRANRALNIIYEIQDAVCFVMNWGEGLEDAKEGLELIKNEDVKPFFEYLKEQEAKQGSKKLLPKQGFFYRNEYKLIPKKWRRVQGFLQDLIMWIDDPETLSNRDKLDAFGRFLEVHADLLNDDLTAIEAKQKAAGQKGFEKFKTNNHGESKSDNGKTI